MASISEAELKAGLRSLKDIKQALLQPRHAPARSRIAGHRAALMIAENMQHGLVGLRKSAEHLAGLASPLVAQTVFINAPFLIWDSRNFGPASPSLQASQIEPWSSWAKVLATVENSNFEGDGFLRDDVGFYYLWQNDTGSDVVVNVSTLLVAYGSWDVLIAPYGSAYLDIAALLYVYEWWNQPPTMPMVQSSQLEDILDRSFSGSLNPVAGGMIYGGDLSYPADPAYASFWIPQGGAAVFEVDLAMYYAIGNGARVDVDFNSGNYQIICPYLRIDIFPGPQPIG